MSHSKQRTGPSKAAVSSPEPVDVRNDGTRAARFGSGMRYVVHGVVVYAAVLLVLYAASLACGALGFAAAREFAVGATLLVAALLPLVAIALAVSAVRRTRTSCYCGAADLSDAGCQTPVSPSVHRDPRAAQIDAAAGVAAVGGSV